MTHGIDALGQDVDEVAVCAGQKASRHFNDRHFGAERRVNCAEFEADVAAADDQQALRHLFDFQRAGRIHHARAVER